MNPTGRRRPLRASHRWSACIVALLWCAAPLLAALHASAEAHRLCAEHGVLEEADGAPADAATGEAGPGARGERTPEHEGCDFARFCRFGQLLAQVILGDFQTLEPAPLSTPALALPAPPIALVDLAPKTSPPVRARPQRRHTDPHPPVAEERGMSIDLLQAMRPPCSGLRSFACS
jgi:hypothetical protein